MVGGALTPVMYIYIGSFVNDIISDIQKFGNGSITKQTDFSDLEKGSKEFIFKMCGLGIAVLLCSFIENLAFNYVTLKQVSIGPVPFTIKLSLW